MLILPLPEFLLSNLVESKKQGEQSPFDFVCPDCSENLIIDGNGYSCISCGHHFSQIKLMQAYCDAVRDSHQRKVFKHFKSLEVQTLNDALARERRENHSLRLENERLRNENLARDPLFQSERLASLEARVFSMEDLVHGLVSEE